MGKVEIKSYFQTGDTWLVDYVEAMPCGCGFYPRQTLKLVQKKKPTQTQVENALNQSKGKNV